MAKYLSNLKEGKTEHLYTVSPPNLGVKFPPRAKFSQMSQYQKWWPTRQLFIILHRINFSPQRDRLLPQPHQVYKYNLVHTHPNDHASCRLFLVPAGHQIHTYADFYTQRRKQSVAHKSGRQFFGWT